MELFGFISQIGILQAVILILGVILVIVEMFHPGFGAPGITGGVLLVLGVVITARNLTDALIMLLIIFVILGVSFFLVLRSATRGAILRSPLILKDSQQKDLGYIGIEDLQFFLGKEGISSTVLRPSGVADFDGVKIDVVSEGGYIKNGSKIRVIKVVGRSILVREA